MKTQTYRVRFSCPYCPATKERDVPVTDQTMPLVECETCVSVYGPIAMLASVDMATVKASKPKIHIVERYGVINAIPFGRSSALLEPVPGNTRPASAKTWPTVEAARAELEASGWEIIGVKLHLLKIPAE